MKRIGKVTATAVLLFFIVFPLVSTAQEQRKRPVIGIAMSGGGALGLAEIGVLRYLEEHRIPVDVIAGTSVGGLLGGLYATGHNAAYLEKLVTSADWKELLQTAANYEDRSVAEKQDWNRIGGVYSIPLRRGFALPGGINTGQGLVRLLSGETLAYWDVQDFNDLPIPFRCVATDLISGETFVLREGHLAEALRATMAIPGIFTPVERDGRLLADGGVLNNLPTNVARDMGAEVILAVTLRVAPPDANELQSLSNIVRQTVNIAVRQNEIQQAGHADIEVAIPVPNLSLMDFSRTPSLIEAGFQAASRNAAALDKLSLSQEQWENYIQFRKSRERIIPEYGALIGISATNTVVEQNATTDLSRRIGGTVSRSHFDDALRGLTAATGFPNAYYGWHSNSAQAGFQVKLVARPATETVFTPFVFYQFSNGEPGRPAFRLGGSTVLKNAYKSKFIGAAVIGTDPGLRFEYYRPFDGSTYFIAPGFGVEHTHFYSYTKNGRSDETRSRVAASFFLGMGTWRHLQLRIGGHAGLDRYSSLVITNGINSSNTHFANPEIKGIINTQDSGRLPNRGFRLNAAAGWSFREHSFPYLELDFDHFQPVGKQFSIFELGRTDTSMGRKLTFYDQFTAGGLNELDAYRYQEIRGDTLLMAGGGFLYRGFNPEEKTFRPIFGSWYEAASVNPRGGNSQFKQSATLGAYTPTPLGLAGAALSFDLKGSIRFRLSLGSFWNRP